MINNIIVKCYVGKNLLLYFSTKKTEEEKTIKISRMEYIQ